MATIKSYTDLSQAKTLSKILPPESVDMYYTTNSNWEGKIIGMRDVPLYIGSDGFVDTEMGEIYAWSLSALLGVLPKGTNISTPKPINELGYCCWNQYDEIYADNPVDACVAMIEILHGLEML